MRAGLRAASNAAGCPIRELAAKDCRDLRGYPINNAISVILGVEIGCIEGLCDSLWRGPPGWFPWCIRGMFYDALIRHTGADYFLLHQLSKLRRNLPELTTSTHTKTPIPDSPTAPPVSRPGSESPPDKEEAGCTVRIIYMGLAQKKMSSAQIPFKGSGDSDVILLHEEWLPSLLPSYYNSGVSICETHIDMYYSLRVPLCVTERAVLLLVRLDQTDARIARTALRPVSPIPSYSQVGVSTR